MKEGWSQDNVRISAMSFFQCIDTVGWVRRRTSSPWKTCHLSPNILSWNRWRKKTEGNNPLTQVHLENSGGDVSLGLLNSKIYRWFRVSRRLVVFLLTANCCPPQAQHWHVRQGGKDWVPKTDVQVANIWICFLWSEGQLHNSSCFSVLCKIMLCIWLLYCMFLVECSCELLRSHCWHLLQQCTEPTFPETLLIAINKQGVNLIDPVTKASDDTHLILDCFSLVIISSFLLDCIHDIVFFNVFFSKSQMC